MIHGKDSTGELTSKAQAYGKTTSKNNLTFDFRSNCALIFHSDIDGRGLLAADRGELNKTFLDALEKFPNVKLFFNHKLTVGKCFLLIDNKGYVAKLISIRGLILKARGHGSKYLMLKMRTPPRRN